MKIMILICTFVICVFIGYRFSRKYKVRLNFFSALVSLCQKFDVEINFSRTKVKNIFLSIDEKTRQKLCGLDENYILYLDGQEELSYETLYKKISFLKDCEKDIIFPFFQLLGRSDVESQSKEIKNYQSKFEEFYKSVEIENKKYGVLSLKLGFISGLFLVVLFL